MQCKTKESKQFFFLQIDKMCNTMAIQEELELESTHILTKNKDLDFIEIYILPTLNSSDQ